MLLVCKLNCIKKINRHTINSYNKIKLFKRLYCNIGTHFTAPPVTHFAFYFLDLFYY